MRLKAGIVAVVLGAATTLIYVGPASAAVGFGLPRMPCPGSG
jgi:hypothetical protein